MMLARMVCVSQLYCRLPFAHCTIGHVLAASSDSFFEDQVDLDDADDDHDTSQDGDVTVVHQSATAPQAAAAASDDGTLASFLNPSMRC